MIDPNQQRPAPAIKCEHCGSESGPHYAAHLVNHQEKTIDPETKNTCHTCFHVNPGKFMHYAEFVRMQSQKAERNNTAPQEEETHNNSRRGRK
jgi:heterodisulfide reductase subunit A-like polyferredoxin